MSDYEPLAVGFAGVAKLLGCTEKHVRNHYIAYGIPHRRLGKRVLFPVDDLREWLSAGRPKPEQMAS